MNSSFAVCLRVLCMTPAPRLTGQRLAALERRVGVRGVGVVRGPISPTISVSNKNHAVNLNALGWILARNACCVKP